MTLHPPLFTFFFLGKKKHPTSQDVTSEPGISLVCLNNLRFHPSPSALQDINKENLYPEHTRKQSLPRKKTHLCYPQAEGMLLREGWSTAHLNQQPLQATDSFWATGLENRNALSEEHQYLHTFRTKQSTADPD